MRKSLFRNLLAYAGSVWMVTVTAPGVDQLPWQCEESGCAGARVPNRGGCSVCGCRRVVPHAAHEWNRTAAKRWSELHRRAQQATRRDLGCADMLLAYVWQLQRRGVLHMHLALAFDTPHERAVAWCYVRHLRRLSRDHGFGLVDARDRDGKAGRSTVMEPQRAAGYMSSYLGNSSQLVEALALNARPRRVVYVSRRLLALTGCTMQRLRRVRLLWRIRTGNSSIFALAGQLPAWFRDASEYAAIAALAAPANAP